MGRTTVQEQVAKLRYELDRACTRAGAHRSLVQQLSHTAATSGYEVAHLRGLLQVRSWGKDGVRGAGRGVRRGGGRPSARDSGVLLGKGGDLEVECHVM